MVTAQTSLQPDHWLPLCEGLAGAPGWRVRLRLSLSGQPDGSDRTERGSGHLQVPGRGSAAGFSATITIETSTGCCDALLAAQHSALHGHMSVASTGEVCSLRRLADTHDACTVVSRTQPRVPCTFTALQLGTVTLQSPAWRPCC